MTVVGPTATMPQTFTAMQEASHEHAGTIHRNPRQNGKHMVQKYNRHLFCHP